MSGTPIQPVTQRTGGGVSARVVALVGVAVLVGLVWLGLSDQAANPSTTPDPLAGYATPRPTATPRPSDTPPPTATAPTAPVPTATPSPSAPLLPGGASGIPRQYGPLGDDAFAATVWHHERFYMSVLREDEPGYLNAVMRLPVFDDMPELTLQLIQLWTRDDRPPLAAVADYRLSLDALFADPPSPLLIDAGRDPAPRPRRAPRLLREGYLLQVEGEVRGDHLLLFLEVRVGDAPPRDNAGERLRRIVDGWSDYGQR